MFPRHLRTAFQHRFVIFGVTCLGVISTGLIIFGLDFTASATTYYVAHGGTATTCAEARNIATPWPRIYYESLGCLAPGDTLYIRGGIYDEMINLCPTVMRNGTAEHPIAILPYPGESVTIRAPLGTIDPSVLMDFSYVQYITVKGFVIDANDEVNGALRLYATSHILIEDNEITGAIYNGIALFADSCAIVGNDVHDNGWLTQGYGSYVSGGYCLIEGNSFHHNGGFGIHMYTQNPGLVSDTLRCNRIYTNGRSGQQLGDGLLVGGSGHVVYNNLIYDTGGPYSCLTINYSGPYDNRIYNNTLCDCGRYGIENHGVNSTLENNIIHDTAGIPIYDAGLGTIQDHNLCSYDCAVSGDPLFVDQGAGDFHLQAESPAIDAGTDLSAYFTTDFDGMNRTAPWDIGAYEFVEETSGAESLPRGAESSLEVSPTPATGTVQFRFSTPVVAKATLRVYGVDGSMVAELILGSIAAGTHRVSWPGEKKLPTGMYWAKLTYDGQSLARSFLVVR